MISRNYRDFLGGLLLTATGLAMALYTIQTYRLGTLRSMGPGMFPAAIGTILALLGLLVAVPALFRAGELSAIRVRSPLFVLASVAAFAAMITPFGLLPAVVASTVISSLAEPGFRPVRLALLCLVLPALAWLIFGAGLGLNVAMFRWPF